MPSRQDVQKALRTIKRAADYEYFFDQLKSPGWIGPLDEEGLFNDPPPPVSDGKYVSLPSWPQSRYLKRIAAEAPNAVLRVALQIPDTDNSRVHEDLVDAALAMPAALSAKFVPKAKKWIAMPYQMLLPPKLADLVAHLADGGETKAALLLARSLLAVRPDSRRLATREEAAFTLPPEPVGWFDTWYYKKALSKVIPALLNADAPATLHMLVKLLNEAVAVAGRDAEKGEDYSYSWRPAIENHPQNTDRHVLGLLVSALRDAAETLIAKDPNQLECVITILESQHWKVFRRMALHLVRVFGRNAPEIVRAQLTDRDLSRDVSLFHEFWLLARDYFDALVPADQSILLGFLDEEYENDLREAEILEDPQERERGRRSAKQWLNRRLFILGGKLPIQWRERLTVLKAEVGCPEHAEFLVYSSVSWVGPTSPKSAADLEQMSTDEVVAFLEGWHPPSGPMEVSPEGLSRTITGVVSATPERFAIAAPKFAGLAPTYVRGLLSGLNDALKGERAFPWEPVLDLCQWVIRQPREIPSRESEYHDFDPGWVWTRKAIADLLASGFEAREGRLSFALRNEAWSILTPLTDDPDPTPEYEVRYGPPNMDPLTLSINSTRGEAMHAVVRYALWVRRQIEVTESAEQRLARGFDEMPEVRTVLDAHLDPASDPSLAIHAVFGQWLPWLLLLDPGWTKKNLPRIFPTAASQLRLREAAWDTYVTYSGVFDNVLDVLSSEYAASLGRISRERQTSQKLEGSYDRLAEHLMVFYLRGKLPLGDSEGLLQQFFKVAPPELRGHALGYIGHTLHGEDNPPVPPEVVDRLVALWDWRASTIRDLPRDACAAELTEYGWWFASGIFSDEWALTQLLSVLKICRKVEASHLVIERLAGLSEKFPQSTIDALRLIADADDEHWGVSLWDQAASRILSTALASKDRTVCRAATDLIHLFGAMGIRSFEHLLEGASG